MFKERGFEGNWSFEGSNLLFGFDIIQHYF